MEILSKADTLKAIQEATAPLVKKIAILEATIESNAELIDSAEASRLSGFTDNRTLKKHFTPIESAGALRFSKAEIMRWKMEQSLPKAPHLHIDNAA